MNKSKLKVVLAVPLLLLLFTSLASADLVTAVGDVQARFKGPMVTNNGNTLTDFTTLESGVHWIEYSGTIADFGVPNGETINEARPFIGFDQAGVAVADFVYFDDLEFIVDGNIVWADDFSGTTLGPGPGTNAIIAGTDNVSAANTLTADIVTDPGGVLAAAGGSGGNALLLSTGTNNFGAIRRASAVTFADVDNTATYSLSFKIFIPSAVPEPSSLGLLGLAVFGLVTRRRRN